MAKLSIKQRELKREELVAKYAKKYAELKAIVADTEPGLDKWLKLNAEYATKWPNITEYKEPPADAKEFDGKPDKFEKYFSPNPGEGS